MLNKSNRKLSKLAVVSFLLSLLPLVNALPDSFFDLLDSNLYIYPDLLLLFVTGAPSVVLGVVALFLIERKPMRGAALARWGVIIGLISFLNFIGGGWLSFH